MYIQIKKFELIFATPDNLYVTTHRLLVNIKSIYLNVVVVVKCQINPYQTKGESPG